MVSVGAESGLDDEISVDEVWDRMGKKLEHMLTSFAGNDVERTHLDAPEWMRMYTCVPPPAPACCCFCFPRCVFCCLTDRVLRFETQ